MKKEELLNDDLIKEELKNKKRIPLEAQTEINNSLFENILIANVVMIYFYFINLGFMNIEREVFLTDLKVFAVTLAVLTLILFETAYKKDNNKIAIHSIESFVISLVTLFSIYICINFANNFKYIIAIISFTISIYYIAKCIGSYIRFKRNYLKENSDIKNIVTKDKPNSNSKNSNTNKNNTNKSKRQDKTKSIKETGKNNIKVKTKGEEIEKSEPVKKETKTNKSKSNTSSKTNNKEKDVQNIKKESKENKSTASIKESSSKKGKHTK